VPVDKWTEEQVLSAIKLYCKIPFGKLHSKNPQIIQLANEIGRTANALALKMVNIASLDPTIDRKGMSNVSKIDKDVWEKFFSNIDHYLEENNEERGGLSDNAQAVFVYDDERIGLNVSGVAVQRRGQAYFREMVLASYDGKCAISGISEPQLLSASHIAPWATETIRRLDPRNGICLNALYDRAFDRGLIAISDEFRVLYSNAMTRETAGQLQSMASKNTIKASRFQPDIALLRAHRVRFGDQFSAP
jgi:putative restriction endonuclease